jgi:hypothetical protein
MICDAMLQLVPSFVSDQGRRQTHDRQQLRFDEAQGLVAHLGAANQVKLVLQLKQAGVLELAR